MKPRSPPLSSGASRPSVGLTCVRQRRDHDPPSDAADEPADNFDRVDAINLRGVWACMKHELRQMREQGSDAIVNCSSLGGLVGLPGRASSVSHHLARLEAETGAQLLQRVGRGIRLTQAGRLLADRAAEIIGRIDAAGAELSAHVGLTAGRVRLAGFSSAIGSLVPRAIAALAAAITTCRSP
jgi:hypothetical protein